MLVECSYCQSSVDATEHGHVLEREEEGTYRVTLLKCPVCKHAIAVTQFEIQVSPDEYDWTKATRIYPDPETTKIGPIPWEVQKSLHEGRLCFRAGAYNACAVMSGRAIEEMS